METADFDIDIPRTLRGFRPWQWAALISLLGYCAGYYIWFQVALR